MNAEKVSHGVKTAADNISKKKGKVRIAGKE